LYLYNRYTGIRGAEALAVLAPHEEERTMGIRPKTKRVKRLRYRRCPKCNKQVRIYMKRCRTCHQVLKLK
jgi:hypothetical protein